MPGLESVGKPGSANSVVHLFEIFDHMHTMYLMMICFLFAYILNPSLYTYMHYMLCR